MSNSSLIHDSVYIDAGNKIVQVTFDSLRGSLLDAISKQGIDEAIKFCNINATAITHQYADTFLIKRTAFRNRNPDNQPDSLELVVLQQMTDEVETKKEARGQLVRTGESIHFFKPIIMQSMCLQLPRKPR